MNCLLLQHSIMSTSLAWSAQCGHTNQLRPKKKIKVRFPVQLPSPTQAVLAMTCAAHMVCQSVRCNNLTFACVFVAVSTSGSVDNKEGADLRADQGSCPGLHSSVTLVFCEAYRSLVMHPTARAKGRPGGALRLCRDGDEDRS